jgi:hypothetical protein
MDDDQHAALNAVKVERALRARLNAGRDTSLNSRKEGGLTRQFHDFLHFSFYDG